MTDRAPGAVQAYMAEEAMLVGIPTALVFYLLFLLLIWISFLVGNGEPFSLFSGVSVWPAVAIRLAVIAGSIWALHFLATRLRRREHLLGKSFAIEANYDRPAHADSFWAALMGAIRRPHRFFEHSDTNYSHTWSTRRPARRRMDDGWRWYLEKSSGRMERCVLAALFVGSVALFVYFNEDMHAGLSRGRVARWANGIVWVLATTSVVMLMLYVLDATLLCCKFMGPLADPSQKVVWTRNSRATLGGDGGFEPVSAGAQSSYLDRLLDVRLVAGLTEEIVRLIWFPFSLLFLHIIAQNSLFENWSWSWLSLTVFSIAIGMMVSASLYLRRCAEKLRNRAVGCLREAQLALKLTGDMDQLDDLSHAEGEVSGMLRGAFLPFSQHPIVAAMLLPFGGVGTLAMLESLTM